MSLTKVIANKTLDRGPMRPEFSYLRLSKIKVLKTQSYSDCTCIETVSFSFEYCDSHGAVSVSKTRFIVESEIETGYRPEESVERDMRRMFSQYPIFNIEQLLAAFKYRDFYR